jgi:hypothetical protein
MLRIVRADGAELQINSLTDQIYSMEDDLGWQWHWSVTEALRKARDRGERFTISLSEMGITTERIRSQYDGMDEVYAMSVDLTQPLIFVPFRDKHQLVDGWHRLFKASVLGVDELLAYILTDEEADACLVCKLPPGQGIDWGQPKRR